MIIRKASFFLKIGLVPFFILLLLLAACIPKEITDTTNKAGESDSIRFFVVNHGYHLSFVIPTKTPIHDWRGQWDQLNTGKYMELAWGDSGYYQHGGLMNGAKALIWPTNSVIHVAKVDGKPAKYFPNSTLYFKKVCSAEFEQLLTFIEKSFARDQDGSYIYLDEGLYGTSGFYRANPSYHLIYNCNNWVNEGLYRASLKTPLWGGMAWLVGWYL